jgi:hypothetical protein
MRLSEAEALEGAMKKVEQLHGLYVRTLKTLQEQLRLRTAAGARHAELVKVGPIRIGMDDLCFPSPGSNSPFQQGDAISYCELQSVAEADRQSHAVER